MSIESMLTAIAGPGPDPSDPTPIRTAIIHLMGGMAPHETAGLIVPHPTIEVLDAVQFGVSIDPKLTAATVAVVVYSSGSAILRKIIIPDTDSDLADHHPQLGSGESSLTVPVANIKLDQVKTAVTQATTKTPPSGRAVVVDRQTNIVVECLMADPALDQHPEGSIISNDLATFGDTYNPLDGHFSRLYATVDSISGKVAAVGFQPIDNVLAPQGFFVIEAGKLKVGDIVPIIKQPV